MPTPEAPSTKVIEEVADREGVDPTALETPLYDCIDPDALDAVFQRGRNGPGAASGRVEFEYHGYRVVVEPSGRVQVERAGLGPGPGDPTRTETPVD